MHIILQERDRRMLNELTVLKVADSGQLITVAPFQSVRRANDRLLRLVQAGLMRRAFVGTIAGGKKSIFWLSPRGAAAVGAKGPAISYAKDQLVTADQFLNHQLQINDIYLALMYRPLPEAVTLRRWVSFSGPLSESIRLIPDGYGELQTPQGFRCLFLEVDLGNESQRIWEQKVKMYLQLAISGEFTRLFSQPQFRVLVVANSERRLRGIRRTVSAATDKVFWLTTVTAIKEYGLFAGIWLRPTGDVQVSLFDQLTTSI